MSANCSDKLVEDCMSSCMKVGHLTDLGCRLVHCEMAGYHAGKNHCEHAVGKLGFCLNTQNLPLTCKDKGISGWTCERHDECCSGVCDQDKQVCN